MEIIIEKIKTYEKGKFAGFEYIFHYMGKTIKNLSFILFLG